MDNNIIGSSFGSIRSKQKDGKTGEGGEADDLGLFSKMLEKHTSKIDKDVKDSASQEIYSDKKEKEKASEESRLKARPGKSNIEKGNKAYLYDLSIKDPDSLSMTQKKTAGMEIKHCTDGEHDAIANRIMSRGAKSTDEIARSDKKTGDLKVGNFSDALKDKGKDEVKERSQGMGGRIDTFASKDAPVPGGEDLKAGESDANAERNVKREEIIKQILSHIELRNLGNRTELTLKLNPEFLGGMKLKLLMEGDIVTAEFNTVSPAVREAMEESKTELKNALTGQGVKVGRMKIKLVDKLD